MPLPKDPIKREEWLAKQRSRVASIDTRIKMSMSRIGKKKTDETKKKISDARIGYIMTDTTKKKISIYNKGKKLSVMHKERISNSLKNKYKKNTHHMLGKKLSKRTIVILKKYHTEINPLKGEHNPNWKGGITKITQQIRSMEEYNIWRKDIFKRDNYTCLSCNKFGGVIEAHHIIPFSFILLISNIKSQQYAINCELLWDINNGITLCKSCHNKIHRRND